MEQNFYKKVGENIRNLRQAAGLTQAQMAEILGVTFQQLQKYESGGNRMPLDRLCAAAAHLGVPAAEFMPPECGTVATYRTKAPRPLDIPPDVLNAAARIAALRDKKLRQKTLAVIDTMIS